jgi:hypothetical protein
MCAPEETFNKFPFLKVETFQAVSLIKKPIGKATELPCSHFYLIFDTYPIFLIKAAHGAKFHAVFDLPASVYQFGFCVVIAIVATITINANFFHLIVCCLNCLIIPQ